MNLLDKFLIYEIFYYLPNEDVYKINRYSKKYREITLDEVFYENILYRNHPMVFNLLDNYCKFCNIQMHLIMKDEKLLLMNCSHLYDI